MNIKDFDDLPTFEDIKAGDLLYIKTNRKSGFFEGIYLVIEVEEGFNYNIFILDRDCWPFKNYYSYNDVALGPAMEKVRWRKLNK